MDVIEAFRRFGPRVWRRPVLMGLAVGGLVAWGLGHTKCALKDRGTGDCAVSLPGEHTLVGQLTWGLAAGVATGVILVVMRRRAEAAAARDRGLPQR